ncbi:hypothetical protein EMCRGX_G025269 [Ephydatia muelleri]
MSILLSTKAALRNSDVKGVASLHAITSPKLPSSVDETDGQEVEKIQTVLAPPTQTALAPPPAVNSSIIRTAAVIFMVQAFLGRISANSLPICTREYTDTGTTSKKGKLMVVTIPKDSILVSAFRLET